MAVSPPPPRSPRRYLFHLQQPIQLRHALRRSRTILLTSPEGRHAQTFPKGDWAECQSETRALRQIARPQRAQPPNLRGRTMNFSAAGLDLLMRSEGFRSHVYKDAAG